MFLFTGEHQSRALWLVYDDAAQVYCFQPRSNLPRTHTRRVKPSDERAYGCAGDAVRFDAGFIQCLQDADMDGAVHRTTRQRQH